MKIEKLYQKRGIVAAKAKTRQHVAKNVSNYQNASPFSSNVASAGFPIFDLSVLHFVFSSLLNSRSVIPGPVSSMDPSTSTSLFISTSSFNLFGLSIFAPFCPSASSPFFFPRFFRSGDIYYQDLNVYHNTTYIFSSLIKVLTSILLLLENDDVVQCLVNPLETSRKRLQLDIDKTNKNKLWYQPVVAIREKKIVRLLFSCHVYSSEIKLNIEWQMVIVLKKINLDMTNKITLLAVLY